MKGVGNACPTPASAAAGRAKFAWRRNLLAIGGPFGQYRPARHRVGILWSINRILILVPEHYNHAMKVSRLGSDKSVSRPRKKKPSPGKGAEFADQLKVAAGTAAAAGGIEPSMVKAADSLLAVQEVSTATEERSRGLARRYGEHILDGLENIQHGLLEGAVLKEKMADLARAVRTKRQRIDDPRLKEIIDEIELRAEVEIAKLTRDV